MTLFTCISSCSDSAMLGTPGTQKWRWLLQRNPQTRVWGRYMNNYLWLNIINIILSETVKAPELPKAEYSLNQRIQRGAKADSWRRKQHNEGKKLWRYRPSCRREWSLWSPWNKDCMKWVQAPGHEGWVDQRNLWALNTKLKYKDFILQKTIGHQHFLIEGGT